MKTKLSLKHCPTCGHDIDWVVKDIVRQFQGKPYTVPQVGFYLCPNCGEKVYDKEAMLKIQAHSPAYHAKKELVPA